MEEKRYQKKKKKKKNVKKELQNQSNEDNPLGLQGCVPNSHGAARNLSSAITAFLNL